MLKQRVWKVLDGQNMEGPVGIGFNVFILVLIFLNVIAVALETVPRLNSEYQPVFEGFELVSVIVFTVEYLLRLWSCTAAEGHEAPIKGRLRFVLSPMALVDLLAVLPFYLPMLVAIDMRFLRALRLLRVFRLLKVGRYARSLGLLKRVIVAKREELFITGFVLALCLVLSASVIYYAEHDAQPEAFSSIPQSLWWAICTLSTVGYGDSYPVTTLGQVFASVIAVVGIGLFSLPAGLLASGFMEEYHRLREEKRTKAQELVSGAGGHTCPHCGGGLSLQVSAEPARASGSS